MVDSLPNELRERLRPACRERFQSFVLVLIELDLRANHGDMVSLACIHDAGFFGPGRTGRTSNRLEDRRTMVGTRTDANEGTPLRYHRAANAPPRRQPELPVRRAPFSRPVRGGGPLGLPGRRAPVPVHRGVGVCHPRAAPGARSARRAVQSAGRAGGGSGRRRQRKVPNRTHEPSRSQSTPPNGGRGRVQEEQPIDLRCRQGSRYRHRRHRSRTVPHARHRRYVGRSSLEDHLSGLSAEALADLSSNADTEQ